MRVMTSAMERWAAYRRWHWASETLGVSLDLSKMMVDGALVARLEPRFAAAFSAMAALEKGAIGNPDENRMVGHYWLRAPELAPSAELAAEIQGALAQIRGFTAKVHGGEVAPERAARFRRLLVIGIGGSALGPQLASAALGGPADALRPSFVDNTDPDGIDRTLGTIGDDLKETLAIVISKSGGTMETRNGMLEVAAAYERAGLSFAKHAVAVTGAGSKLDELARAAGWLARFPMWDWVGGRTSETSAVGLLPAALQGLDWEGMLAGAREMDVATRVPRVRDNPAALLALGWYAAGDGRGAKDMVVLPYKDRLELFSRYLQQLVMESLGKEKDLEGKVVHQGIAVYGNKGSTDQHAFVQQLRDGVANFFVTFLEVLQDRGGQRFEVEPGLTSGDYLSGFLQGTRSALAASGRPSMTLTVDRMSGATLGKLIALYERAVGLYASLVGINAYHQPGVEAGKKAAGEVLAVQAKVVAALRAAGGKALRAEEVAAAAGVEDVETVYLVLRHLAANAGSGVRRTPGATPFDATFAA